MISYNNSAPNAVNNVGQFGATEGSIGAYKSAAEYAADSKYWAMLSQKNYNNIGEILKEVERLYTEGNLLKEDIEQLKSDFENQNQILLGLIQQTGEAVDDTNTAISDANAATDRANQAVQDVLTQLDKISNMSVVATTLPPGAPATGSFDNSTGVFSFGIPEGQPGKDGKDGTDGTISDIGDVAISTPVSDDYGFFVDKDDGGLYRTPMSEIAKLVPAVISFNGRTGPVVPAAGDYTVSQVTGAAASGVNSDINEIRGLTTALSVAQGGTGATTAVGARANLNLDRFGATGSETQMLSPSGSKKIVISNDKWGAYDTTAAKYIPLGIEQGGTGGGTADAARMSLVAAKSGDNSDITSMTNKVTFTQSPVVPDAIDASDAVTLRQLRNSSDSDGILANKQAVARYFGVKESEVVYFSVGAVLDGYKVIYDKGSQRAYSLPADLSSEATAVSLSAAGVLVHSVGEVDLGELAITRGEYVTLPGSFDSGVTVNTKNELVVFTEGKYRWDGALPKEVPAGSSPSTTGGVAEGAWVYTYPFSKVLPALIGYTGGDVYPPIKEESIKVGQTIPAGVRYVRVNGNLTVMSSPLAAPLVITSFDETTINSGVVELYPSTYFNEVSSGWKVARSDEQLQRLLPTAGNIGIAYSPVRIEGIFSILGDIRLTPFLPKVIVDSRQFWLRAPRTWNETNQEYDYTAYDARVIGNFHFKFNRQDADFDPGVGLAIQSGGTLEVSGCELEGAWNSNMTLDYGRWALVDNVYSHDCGRGQIQQPDGSNRQGMAIIVGNATEAHVHHIRTRTTWASSVFIDSYRPGRTLNVMVHDVSINGSGGNGLRIQSDDLVTGVRGGQGTAITRVNISNVTIKNCSSHGLRANFTNGSVTGVFIESCNAGISIEGSSDVIYDNIIIRNCSQGILCRFYPVVCTRLRFGNVLISGCTDWALYFQAAAANTTVNLGDIEFDGVTIHCLASESKAVFISCGSNSVTTSDITMKNFRIVGAFSSERNGSIIQIYNSRHFELDNCNIRGVNGTPEAYLSVQASQSVLVNRLVGLQPFGTVNRPIAVSGGAKQVNISNCVIPQTTSPSIGYSAPVPANRYEASNQFSNSNQPQQFQFTNSVTLRGGDANALTTSQLASIVATLINDISLGKYVIR